MAAKKKPAKGKKLGKKAMKKTKGGLSLGNLGSAPISGRAGAMGAASQSTQGPGSPGTFTSSTLPNL